MKKITLFFVLVLCTLSARAELPAAVTDALKIAGIPLSSVAIYVQAVDANIANQGELSINLNAEKSMNPASVMKLVTTNAALDLLTPVYRWKTEAYKNGEIANGTLKGDLMIKGYGDPSFGEAEFRRFLVSLQQAGIKQIKGDLIIDKSFFAKNVGSRNTFDNETWRAYNAIPSAFLVNGRNTSFKFVATEAGVNISQELELDEVKIINNMKLSQGACGEWRSHFGYTVKPTASGATVAFNGTFSADCGERYLELSVFNDEKYALYMFKKLWRQLGGNLGGSFNGNLKVQELPIGATKILEQVSDPLGYVVRDINKWSDNLMARQLLLTLAAEKNGTPATEAKGAEVIKTWLASKNLNFNELVIENGSGLSRVERISAAHLGQLLVSAYQSPVMPELMASLPILSLDGTVQKRLKESAVSGRAHLKTGSIDGVSAIAGYILDEKNRRHVLVMLVNHTNAAASKNAQDALVNWVYLQQ